MIHSGAVVKLTGIHNSDLLSEWPLSVVLKEFFSWLETTTREYAENIGKESFPGTCLCSNVIGANS